MTQVDFALSEREEFGSLEIHHFSRVLCDEADDDEVRSCKLPFLFLARFAFSHEIIPQNRECFFTLSLPLLPVIQHTFSTCGNFKVKLYIFPLLLFFLLLALLELVRILLSDLSICERLCWCFFVLDFSKAAILTRETATHLARCHCFPAYIIRLLHSSVWRSKQHSLGSFEVEYRRRRVEGGA